MTIDVTFDFRTDAGGKDPDASSPTLLRYHHLLWSKSLPSGKNFRLTPRSKKPYALLHDSDLGTFHLTSDSVLATFTTRRDMHGMPSVARPNRRVVVNGSSRRSPRILPVRQRNSPDRPCGRRWRWRSRGT